MAKVAIRRSSSLRAGLVAYWALDETSGTRYDAHGTNHLTPTATLGHASGKVGSNAIKCIDESDDYAYITETPAALNFDGTSFTIAFWYYPYSFPATELTYHMIMYNWSQSIEMNEGVPTWYHRGYWLMTATNPAVAFGVGGGGEPAAVIHITGLVKDAWNFIICEHDADAQQISGSLNLVVKDTLDAPKGILPSIAAMFRIGTLATSYQDGLLDEIGVWGRVLTTAEKNALYNGGAGTTYPFA